MLGQPVRRTFQQRCVQAVVPEQGVSHLRPSGRLDSALVCVWIPAAGVAQLSLVPLLAFFELGG